MSVRVNLTMDFPYTVFSFSCLPTRLGEGMGGVGGGGMGVGGGSSGGLGVKRNKNLVNLIR